MKKLFALLLFGASVSWGAIAHVQSKACGANSVTTASCAFDSPVTAGSLLIVPCAGSRLSAALSVTDDNGNNYTLINGTTTTSNPLSGQTVVFGIWFATNAVAGFTTVTCTDLNSNTTWIENPIHEYSGASLTNAFDIWSSSMASASISTTSVTSGPMATSKGNELIFGFAPALIAAPTAGNGTIRINSGVSSFYATEDAILANAGVYQSSFTVPSGNFVPMAAQAAFSLPNAAPRGVETWQ